MTLPEGTGQDEQVRLVAWHHELLEVHDRLRAALRLTRETPGGRDLLVFCHGFCTALTAHHEGEDRRLFPVLEAAHPELAATVRALRQDHSMIAHLLTGLQASVDAASSPEELHGHLEGVAAIMESHFRYEERRLLGVLATLELAADAGDVLGPL